MIKNHIGILFADVIFLLFVKSLPVDKAVYIIYQKHYKADYNGQI